MMPITLDNRSERTLIDELLDRQGDLTAAGRFSHWHDDGRGVPALAARYRELIPLTKPGPGEQYAFEVDLDRCSGCKACVSACHSMNGLEDGEMWRSVGILVGKQDAEPPRPGAGGMSAAENEILFPAMPYLQHVTTACHHCVEPGCADGCPVLAYEKDPVTGIVRHLDDQCIGCQYCVLKCPYDVPKFSLEKGIVRKCDMCQGRLAAGEAPACVQACPHEAIRISVIRVDAVRMGVSPETAPSRNGRAMQPADPDDAEMKRPEWSRAGWLPDAPDARITLPTTRYVSARPLPPGARSADAAALRVESGHLPLVIMLVLTQLAGGLHLLHVFLLEGGLWNPSLPLAGVATVMLMLGLAASVAHLGRPLKAWRAFLGWRRSWMSREIIAFSFYAAAAVALAFSPFNVALAWVTAIGAMVAVGCSAMIYVDTKRPAWRAEVVFPRFAGTTLLLGATAGAALSGWFAPALAPGLAVIATLIRTALFASEWMALIQAFRTPGAAGHASAVTVLRLLRPVIVARSGLFVASTLFSVLAIFNAAGHGNICGSIAFVTTLAGQLIERYMFFAACAPPRMPEGIGVGIGNLR